jgi:hypothetical protein
LDIFENNGMKPNFAQVLHNFGQHELAIGNSQKAQELFGKEREISKRLNINTEAKCVYFKKQNY